jgi:hypothetical protein
LELLDAVEAGISALRTRSVPVPAGQAGSETATALLTELRAAGISAAEFARLTGIPREAVEDWTVGSSSVPQWVPAAVRLVALLTPSARRKLLHGPASAASRPPDRTQCHPFSRIEEL